MRPERWRTGSSGIGSLTPGKRPAYYRLGGSRVRASNATLDPVAVSMDSHYDTFIPFQPGAKGTRWAAQLVWERRA